MPDPELTTEEASTINSYVSPPVPGLNAEAMAAETPPSKNNRILWLKALAAAIAAHQ